jgi:membrane protease YdiL (CAAX protease family)
MKSVGFAALWLAVFLPVGFVAGEICRPFLVVGLHNPFWAIWPYAGELGAATALILFVIVTIFRWLPGIRRSHTQPVKFGSAQAIWLLAGFLLMQLVGFGGLLLLLSLFKLAVTFTTQHAPSFDSAGGGAEVAATLAGTLAAGGWSVWYIARRGPLLLHDGRASGIAWCAAPVAGYFTALLLAILIILIVTGLLHLFPPDLTALDDLPDSQLFSTPGWPAVAILLLVVCIAPLVEEFVFRGGIFAALATRFSPLFAGIVTTAVFVAVHAPDKIHYPPGFVDVGLMAAAAAWMRVKFQSIRPGILLHILYNAGLMVAAGMTG